MPNLLAEALIYALARYALNSRDVPGGAVEDLLRAIGEHYCADFRGVRIVQLSRRAAGVLRLGYRDLSAATWCSTVYLMPGAVGWNEAGVSDSESLDTLAHELWHVHQFRRSGGGLPWIARWLREYRRHGVWDMPIEVEARKMAAGFVGRWREHNGPAPTPPGADAGI